MEVDEFVDSLTALERLLKRKTTKRVNTSEERNAVRAVVATWFQTYRPLFSELLGSEEPLAPTDSLLQKLLSLTTGKSARSTYRSCVQKARKLFRDNILIPLAKAYWERPPATSSSHYDEIVATRLEAMAAAFRDSYEQVIADLSTDDRKSYKGTANELRELLREVLHRLAPDEAIRKQRWFRDAHPQDADSIHPKHADRTKYILRQRGSGDSVIDAVKDFTGAAEDLLGRVVRSTYSRASASSHTYQAREEVRRQLRYMNALFLELLPRT